MSNYFVPLGIIFILMSFAGFFAFIKGYGYLRDPQLRVKNFTYKDTKWMLFLSKKNTTVVTRIGAFMIGIAWLVIGFLLLISGMKGE